MSLPPHEKISEVPDAPVLTLPPEEAAIVRQCYASARVILEYGSGGSTLLASGDKDKTIFSVESDAEWSANLAEFFVSHPPAAKVILHTVNVGPTGSWGRPLNEKAWKRYYNYPLSVWDRPDFVEPDLILIDGRFRAACFVAAALRISRPTLLLWDDYTNRKAYHEVERWILPTSIHGRMARFDLAPMVLEGKDLSWVLKQFTRVL